MKKYKDLSICVPVYNEEKSIEEVLNDLISYFPEAEIIVVNDCSKDNTQIIAEKFPGIKIYCNSTNRGYSYSLKRAISKSTKDYIAWFDGDGQHKAKELKKLIDLLVNDNKDVVIGVRTKDSYNESKRKLGKYILKFTAQLIVRQKIPDFNSGLRCFRRNVIMKYLHLFPERFSVSTVTTIIMMKRNYNIGYCDIDVLKRQGKSSVKIFKDGFQAIILMFHLLILFEAFPFFTILSLLQLIPALIYGIVITIIKGQGFPVFASICIMSGIMTFLIGILCDQITHLRREKFETFIN